MNHIEIVKKLIGPIIPVGESNEDARRLENLSEWAELADAMVFELICAAQYRERYESSMQKIGQSAEKFLRKLQKYEFSR